MILRCTGKLLKVLGVHPGPAVAPTDGSTDLEWYANLLWFDRRKCVLATHADTLFSVFVPDVRKQDMIPIGSFIVGHIEEALIAEDLPADTFGRLGAADVRVAKTVSRSVLGCMNDMAWMLENDLMRFDSLGVADILAVNRQLRRSINSPNGYKRPIDLARAHVGEREKRLPHEVDR